MNISLQIKSLLSEAEVYRSQGLFPEAKDKYQAASVMIHNIQRLKNKESLLKAISIKIESLEEKTKKVETGPASPELSEKGQNLIKSLFGENDLQKAVALAKFGQFERAIVELTELLNDDRYRVDAAKNILRCKMAVATIDDAIAQYHQWYSEDRFAVNQMESVRTYLQSVMDQKGIDRQLPLAVGDGDEKDPVAASEGIEFSMPEAEEEILDITSIGITFTSGSHQGKMVEFDVNFQSGDMLSLIISQNDKGLIDDLNDGDQVEDIQFYSPIAMFKGTAVIANKTRIESGPKQGDFCLDLKISSM